MTWKPWCRSWRRSVTSRVDPGGMEPIAAYPEVIWLIAFGTYRIRKRRRSPVSAPELTPATGDADPPGGGPRTDAMPLPVS